MKVPLLLTGPDSEWRRRTLRLQNGGLDFLMEQVANSLPPGATLGSRPRELDPTKVARFESLVNRGLDYFIKKLVERMPRAQAAPKEEVAMQGVARLTSGKVIRMADIARARNLAGVPVLGFDFGTLFSSTFGGSSSGWAGVLQPVVQAGTQYLTQRYIAPKPPPPPPPPPSLTVVRPATQTPTPILVAPAPAEKSAIPTWVWLAGGSTIGLGGLFVMLLMLRRRK